MQVPADAPPVFITGATDDSFGFAPDFAMFIPLDKGLQIFILLGMI